MNGSSGRASAQQEYPSSNLGGPEFHLQYLQKKTQTTTTKAPHKTLSGVKYGKVKEKFSQDVKIRRAIITSRDLYCVHIVLGTQINNG
jgi:hypothetical protein